MNSILIGKTKKQFQTTIFSTNARFFGWGLLITSVAQPSSLTSSIIALLVATGKVKLNRDFKFIFRASLGTTIAFLLAATIQSEATRAIAIAHFLFNSIGVIFFLFVPFLVQFPELSEKK